MNGASYTFNAKGGVVLATGGFGANPEMVKKYNPKIDERFKTTDAPGTTGEALYMAERAGAQLVNMGYIQTYPICDPISGVIELIADARFDGPSCSIRKASALWKNCSAVTCCPSHPEADRRLLLGALERQDRFDFQHRQRTSDGIRSIHQAGHHGYL